MSEREVMRMADVVRVTGLSISTVNRALKRDDGTFPKPTRNGERGNLHFDGQEVREWVAARKRVTDLVKSFGVPDDFMDAVRAIDDEAMTDSLQVAKRYKKRPADVLRSFDKLKCSPEFRQRNFALAEYIDDQGKPRRMVRMTKDGFVLLVGKFTSEDATIMTERYIACYNAMGRYIIALEAGIIMAGDADVIVKLQTLRESASHYASGLATVGHQIRRCEAHEGAVVTRASSAIDTRQIGLPFDLTPARIE
jgi:Rha family phage regulatory protein